MSVATAKEAQPSEERGAMQSLGKQGGRLLDAPQTTEAALQKKRFLLFVKILFKSLEQSADSETREKAKEIVSDCTRRNRLGDPAFTPLMEAVDRLLRGKVGEPHWRRAHVYMQHYLRRSQLEKAKTNHRQQVIEVSLHPTQQAEV
jgi:hypothetical protein